MWTSHLIPRMQDTMSEFATDPSTLQHWTELRLQRSCMTIPCQTIFFSFFLSILYNINCEEETDFSLKLKVIKGHCTCWDLNGSSPELLPCFYSINSSKIFVFNSYSTCWSMVITHVICRILFIFYSSTYQKFDYSVLN